jgi:hypothetical protein
MKRSIIILGLLFIILPIFSQTVDDALRYSQQYYQGTARNMAMGGSFGALGSDFSVASTNPAGMALYRSSEFSFTPEISSLRVGSTYNNMYNEDSRSILDLSNLGYVSTKSMGRGPWKYFQFSMGMNRLNNFNSNKSMQGENLQNSRLDVYVEQANGVNYSQLDNPNGDYAFDLYPAWYLYLVDTVPGTTNQYYSPVPYAGTMQKQTIRTKGSTNEWLMSVSANYDNKLFIGATMGLPFIRYYSESIYSENDVADTIPFFNSWSVKENLSTSGWGINLKLGVIYQPIEWLRIGGAFHTPTYYWSMRDTWYTTHNADLEWTDPATVSSITGNYEYSLSTPMRLLGDFAVIIAKVGTISAEYEYVDYSTSKFSARGYGFGDVNSDVRQSFNTTHNLRIGTEWRIDKLSVRGGYALYANPYSNDLNDGSRQSFSFGLGYSFGYSSLDFAYVRWLKNEDYYMYSSENYQPNQVENEYLGQHFALTLRSRF